MKYYYADVMPDGRVRACFTYEGPEEGPLEPHWESQAEGEVVLLDSPIDWRGPSDTSILHMLEGKLVWVESAQLEDLISEALAQCYKDIDSIVSEAVGNRAEEYKAAEVDARAFLNSGCVEPAPRSVQKFAEWNPTMQVQTNEWAALQVIGRADALAAAKSDMRDQRFESQFNMRASTTYDELRAAIQSWNNFINNIRSTLGLKPVVQ